MFSNFLKYDTANSIQYQDGFFRIIRFIFLKAILQILHLLSIILKDFFDARFDFEYFFRFVSLK